MRWGYNYFSLEKFNNLVSEDGLEKLDEMGNDG